MKAIPIEILAPVGGSQQLIAAVRSGADAVYLGTKSFNARRNAENFEGNSLRAAVGYCHGRGVRVHVVLNTLVKDSELSLVFNEIEMIASCGADAVIVQDLAVAELFRRHLPSMPLHASTQMAIHNLEGALAAEKMGFSRAVLARELTIDEIRKICSGTRLEIEVFVHGALCMCVSGACYMSSMLGERSGNRGLCAQPCRLNYKLGSREYALSLKDMSHISHIGELIEVGVASLKIEGRMKRPEYVSAAVTACREAAAGRKPDLACLRAVFSRSGFTDGYIKGRRDLQMFGYRTKEDVEASATVLGEIASDYRNELSRVPVEMALTIEEGNKSSLAVSDGIFSVTVLGDIPEKARTKGSDYDLVAASLGKTGGTPFSLHTLNAQLDESLVLPRSKLNSMRKDALQKLLDVRSEIVPKEIIGQFKQPTAGKSDKVPKLRVRLESKEQLSEAITKAENIYMPIGEVDAALIDALGDQLVCELPRLVFPMQEEALEKRLTELRRLGAERICAGNLGSLRLAVGLGFQVYGGFDLNILNSESLNRYEKLGLKDATLSFEINLADAIRLGGEIQRGVLGYGHLPLMTFRNCPAKEKSGCEKCRGQSELWDRTGACLKITCDNREYSSLLNHIPLYLGDKNVRGLDFVTLYFTTEDRQECAGVWDSYFRGHALEGQVTRGLYYRKLK